jgi:hypothetical protein
VGPRGPGPLSVRFLGVILALAGGGLTVRAILGTQAERRPRDVVWALVAPLAIVLALLGALLIFVPGFLG